FELLLRQLNEKLSGIPIGRQSFKLLVYANVLSIGLGSASDWNSMLYLFRVYEKASNTLSNDIFKHIRKK
ncbi:5225_t:CDS:1, partial [Gigaspora rosea]